MKQINIIDRLAIIVGVIFVILLIIGVYHEITNKPVVVRDATIIKKEVYYNNLFDTEMYIIKYIYGTDSTNIVMINATKEFFDGIDVGDEMKINF